MCSRSRSSSSASVEQLVPVPDLCWLPRSIGDSQFRAPEPDGRECSQLAVNARSMAEPQGLVSLADPTFDSKAVVVNFGSTAGLARAYVRVQPASSAKRNFG